MNKLLVISGGTKGIGRAIIDRFASAGFDIATCSRNLKDLQVLKDHLETAHKNCNVMIFKADMADKMQVKSFADFVKATARPVEMLVNNSGYFVPGQILNEPEGTLEGMIHGNLYSAYYLTRGIVPLMREKKKGHIFNICSIASIMAYKNGGSYAISKFALLGFSKCIREELKEQGIRVTSVLPGATFTRSWEGADFPEDRFMKSEDVAEMIFTAYNISPRTVVEELLIRPQLGDI
jgi:short-subunit dehydrogenase